MCIRDRCSIYQKDPALFDEAETPEAKPEGAEREAFVKALKAGQKPRVGSQHRDKAEPKTGQTTLTSEPPGPFCRDLGAVKAELEAAAKAAAKAAAEEAAAKK